MVTDVGLEQGKDLAAQVQGLLNTDQVQPIYEFHVITDPAKHRPGSEDELPYRESALVVNVQHDEKANSNEATLRSLVPVLDIRHESDKYLDADLPPFIAREIRNLFSNEQNTVSYFLDQSAFATNSGPYNLLPESRVHEDGRTTRAFNYASAYHLTFSLFTSSATPSAWEVEKALDEIIQPLLERMSYISEFTIDTQVQLYASFSPSIAGPRFNTSAREWQLQKSDLSGFINAAEWPLSPSIGMGPTINFVLFVPSKDQSPLTLAETGGSSWVIPQWGAVQILNPPGKQPERLTLNELRPVMLTFADQLASLVGLPQSPPSLSLRIARLTRERATSLILSTSSTLGALSRLTLKLKSIAIPDQVATSVAESIQRLDQACQHLQDGKYQRALENARIAEEEAEKAFFEPSMVGQVYFPEEHKVAVYVPLLGPMAVPLVISAMKELRKLRTKKSKIA